MKTSILKTVLRFTEILKTAITRFQYEQIFRLLLIIHIHFNVLNSYCMSTKHDFTMLQKIL